MPYILLGIIRHRNVHYYYYKQTEKEKDGGGGGGGGDRVREKKKKRNRDRERNRQTDKHTEEQTDIHTDRQTDKDISVSKAQLIDEIEGENDQLVSLAYILVTIKKKISKVPITCANFQSCERNSVSELLLLQILTVVFRV